MTYYDTSSKIPSSKIPSTKIPSTMRNSIRSNGGSSISHSINRRCKGPVRD